MKNNIHKKEYVITKAEYDKLTEAYNKCQEDMADKKYTEEDMYNCWETAFTDAMNCSNKDYKPFWFKDYINSLNKQD